MVIILRFYCEDGLIDAGPVMIVLRVNMPLVSQRSLEDWEMISLVLGGD